MTKDEVKIIALEAEQLVQDHCSKLTQSMLEMNYDGAERDAFLRLASSQLLGGACDLFLEFHDADAVALARMTDFRVQAKKARDNDAKTRDLH